MPNHHPDLRARITSAIRASNGDTATMAVADLWTVLDVIAADEQFRADVQTYRHEIGRVHQRLLAALGLPARTSWGLPRLVEIVRERLTEAGQ